MYNIENDNIKNFENLNYFLALDGFLSLGPDMNKFEI